MNYSTKAPSLDDPKNTIYVWPEDFSLSADKSAWVYQFWWKTQANGGMGIRIGVRAAPEVSQALATLIKIWPELWKKEEDPARLAELRSELDGPAPTPEANVWSFVVPEEPHVGDPHWQFLGQLLTCLLYQSDYLCLERFIQWPPRNGGRSCYAREGLDKVYGIIQELHKKLAETTP